MSIHTCSICTSGKFHNMLRIERDNFVYNIVKCNTCGVIHTIETMETVSPEYVALSDEDIDENRIWCQGKHKDKAFKIWLKQFETLFKHNIPNKLSLLDVGCGTGGFLDFAKSVGFETFGFDASAAQISFASRQHEHVHTAVTAEEFASAYGNHELRFDVITLWDVLEHIRDPLLFLSDLKKLMHPDGVIFVSVPNGNAMLWKKWLYQAIGRNIEDFWTPWEHVFYHTPASLQFLFNRSGLMPIKTGAVSCYDRPLSIFELCRRLGFRALNLFPNQAPQIFCWAKFDNTLTIKQAK